MAGLAVIIICLTLALIWMWKRMEKMKQEIYTFTDRLEECLDAMASGEEIRIRRIGEDSVDKVYERLRRIENIWSRREEESVAEKKQIKELISDISHQTKTPIANIKIYLELLDNEKEITERNKAGISKRRADGKTGFPAKKHGEDVPAGDESSRSTRSPAASMKLWDALWQPLSRRPRKRRLASMWNARRI